MNINAIIEEYMKESREPNFNVGMSIRLPASTIGILHAYAQQKGLKRTTVAQELLIHLASEMQESGGIKPDYSFLPAGSALHSQIVSPPAQEQDKHNQVKAILEPISFG